MLNGSTGNVHNRALQIEERFRATNYPE